MVEYRFPRLLLLSIAPAFLSMEQETTQLARSIHSSLNQNPIYKENQQPGTTRWQSAELQRDSDQQLFPSPSLLSVSPQAMKSVSDRSTWQAPTISGYAD